MLFLLESLVPKKRDSISKNNHVTVNARSFATGEKGSVCGPRTGVGRDEEEIRSSREESRLALVYSDHFRGQLLTL